MTLLLPALIPDTRPDGLTVAMLVSSALQLPAGVALASVVVAPVHTRRLPVMAAGAAFMVIGVVVKQVLGSV